MSNFTPTVKYEVNFDGDHVVFHLRRLKVKQRAKILASANGDTSPENRESLIADTAAAVLPECVVSMAGLTIEGAPVKDVADIVDETYFLGLLDNLLAELLRISRVREDEAKNSSGPSGDTSKE